MNKAPEHTTALGGRTKRIVALPGDGVGPEVMASARELLGLLARCYNFEIHFEEHLIGGAALEATGVPLPEETVTACERADAVLLGAVGGPAWDHQPAALRPEQGLLQLRARLGLYCNLRPVVTHPALYPHSPLKSSRLAEVDLVLVRELTGGIYFGAKRRDADSAEDQCAYTRQEIERVTHKACALAARRRGKLTLVDKANVLETSRLWREVVTEIVNASYSRLDFETMLVDAAAMHLLSRPAAFDVILTENLFGDILSDETAMLCGSLGLLPSASLRDDSFGLYEPVHGSAPDIAGEGLSNPCAMLLSAAMMLRHSLGEPEAADALESAVRGSWQAGAMTRDLIDGGMTTREVTQHVSSLLDHVRSPRNRVMRGLRVSCL